MKDFKTIVNEYRKVDLSQRKAALATVVKVQGSSYRSPGARMLITDDGRWVGSISGGCLEGDALRKARQVMSENKPVTVTYDTSEESNQNLGIGLGCNGIIDVLIEPIDAQDESNAVSLFEKFVNTQEPLALGTIFTGVNSGEKLLLDFQGNVRMTFSSLSLVNLVKPDLHQLLHTMRSETKVYYPDGEAVEVFIELVQPTVSLILFGGGFDARPVGALAKSLGWEVVVTDECVAHIAPAFFPTADKLSLCKREYVDRDFEITPHTACVLMSHNYEYDRDVLKKLLPSESPYIGILGPRKRFNKMLDEFANEGIPIHPNDLLRIHSPIGLDIGAEAPDEIAVSIVAEIQSKFTNRSGGFLKLSPGPIHPREKTDQVLKPVYKGK